MIKKMMAGKCIDCKHCSDIDGKNLQCDITGREVYKYAHCNKHELLAEWREEKPDNNQAAKQDAGKPRISLVLPEIIRAIAKVREYGTEKYGDKDNWKTVDAERFYDAFLRHVVASMGDMKAVDEESGLPHLHHAACNLAFILEKMGDEGSV